jgi:hypothetical protein
VTAFGVLKAANSAEGRSEHDFYPTPPEVTFALVPKLIGWPRTIWEPACGDGGIAKPLERAGFRVSVPTWSIEAMGPAESTSWR